tara:strand:+ start:2317 stop:3408 length:1092 start_codon:yes stop_codon:yes gene_type:complete
MVLPLLGSFLGSALLPGMFGSALSPLAAGAIGSGLGSLLQGDDLDQAIGTGLTSFMGGKLLGGLGKELGGAAKGAGSVVGENADTLAKLKGSVNPVMQGYNAPKLKGGLESLTGAKGALKSTFDTGVGLIKENPFTAAGVAGGAALADASKQQEDPAKTPFKPRETIPIQQNIQQPPMGYRPGIDPEFNYGFRNPSADELQTKFIQEGGIADLAPTAAPPNEKDLIVNAVNAVKGNMDEQSASIALAQFVQKYGEEALQELVQDVQEGEYDEVGGKAEGMIDGGGDGMSDSVPATIDGEQDLLISKDEYVVDAPTVAMIGNGSSDAGAEKLDKMREDVRKAATGSSMQPEEIDAMGIMGKALS